MIKARSFEISQRIVWEAYLKVKANRGAAGIDQQSLEDFDKDLKGNLYKIWSRMSSGSYFPPPVRLVEIPKKKGGTRPLGIPTVADRIAQTGQNRRSTPSFGSEPPKHSQRAVDKVTNAE